MMPAKDLNDVLTNYPYFSSEETRMFLLSVQDWPVESSWFLLNTLQNESFDGYEVNLRAGAVAGLIKALRNCALRDFSLIISWLKNSLKDVDLEFGRMVLPLLPDCRDAFVKFSAPNEAWGALVEVESKWFVNLPKAEFLAIVGTQILPFARKFAFLPEFRKAYLLASPIYDDGIWCEPFLPLLKKNREVLGSKIILDGKELSPTLANWIMDFEYAFGAPAGQAKSFDLVKYLTASANPKILNQTDSLLLRQVLEFYIWLYSPIVTREDAVAVGLEIENAPKEISNFPSTNASTGGQFPISNQVQSANVQTIKDERQLDTNTRITSVPLKSKLVPVDLGGSGARKYTSPIKSKADIDRMVSEAELPAPSERLELEDGRTHLSDKTGQEEVFVGAINQAVKAKTVKAEDFTARLAKIKEEVLTKRREEESKTPKPVDGVKKVGDNG